MTTVQAPARVAIFTALSRCLGCYFHGFQSWGLAVEVLECPRCGGCCEPIGPVLPMASAAARATLAEQRLTFDQLTAAYVAAYRRMH